MTEAVHPILLRQDRGWKLLLPLPTLLLHEVGKEEIGGEI